MDLLPWMERWDMLPPAGGTLLCAVSGGRDSVCLLHYLAHMAPRCGFSVAAGHLNHGMRPEAQGDEDFVRRLCRELDVPFYTETVPVYEAASRWSMGVEEAGRRARYDFLCRTADAIGAARIATAHHAQDQAETVLLNLLRGSGAEGLTGIPPVRGRIVRPLLQTTRQEIDAYLIENRLSHVEDSTNTDIHYARNRLRRQLWPLLESINPAATEAISRTAEILRGENAYLDALAADWLPPEGTTLPLSQMQTAPEALQPRILRLLLARLPAGKRDVGAVHMEALLALTRQGGGALDLPAGMQAVCRDGQLRLTMRETPLPEMPLQTGVNHWGDWEITLCRAVPDRITVRPWHSRDRLENGRSLKRLFHDAGIPPEARDCMPVICVDGRVAAVYGGTGDTWRELSPPCGEAIEIMIQKRENHKEDTRKW